jgi:hypothetical protein
MMLRGHRRSSVYVDFPTGLGPPGPELGGLDRFIRPIKILFRVCCAAPLNRLS